MDDKAYGPISANSDVRDIAAYLRFVGVEVDEFRAIMDFARGLDVSGSVLCFGTIPFVEAALLSLGRRVPEPLGFPEWCLPWLRRDVCAGTLEEVVTTMRASGRKLFVKSHAPKRLSGAVYDCLELETFMADGSLDGSLAVWFSEPVVGRWKSEWRCFVHGGVLVGHRSYLGAAWETLDEATLEAMLASSSRWPERPLGWTFDVGVRPDDSVDVVELNDGWSVGSYGLSMAVYVPLLMARWSEMCGR